MSGPSPVRRKPRQKRGELRVQQILDATEALILEAGAESITTNHIATRAEVNVGTLYHFFSNKIEIFLAILARSSDDFERAIVKVAALPSLPAEEWIAQLMDAQTEVWLVHAASVRLYETLRSQPETNALVDEADKRIVDLYCEGFKRHCPHIAAGKRRHVARALLIISYALIEDAIFAATTRERQARIREIVPAVRSYICAPPAPSDL